MPLAPFGRAYAAKRTYQGSTGPAAITTLYLALLTTYALDASTGSTLLEPVAVEYARQSVALSAANTTISDTGAGAFNAAIVFPMVSSSGGWGDIIGYALVDAITAGNVFAYGTLPLTSPVVGDIPTVPVNALTAVLT